MTKVGTVDRVCCNREPVFNWKIGKFSLRPDCFQPTYVSPDFNFYGHSWHLRLRPDDGREDCIELDIVWNVNRPENRVRGSLGITTANGETKVLRNFAIRSDGYDVEVEKFFKISELFRRRHELLPLDVLTLTATFEVGRSVAPKKGIRDASCQTVFGDEEEEKPLEKTGCEKVLQDIVNLWTDGKNCDVLLKVGDVGFKAHRTILAARTPVLCAMFEHNTAEKATGEVTIEDCEPAVFEQLLHYIYTGTPRELTAENASALYVLADKYLLNEVKEQCVRCMEDTMRLDTFCNTVKLSLVYKEHKLLKMAKDFLSRNMISVMKTVEWQRFMHEHMTWANEIQICAMELIESRSEKEKRTAIDLPPP